MVFSSLHSFYIGFFLLRGSFALLDISDKHDNSINHKMHSVNRTYIFYVCSFFFDPCVKYMVERGGEDEAGISESVSAVRVECCVLP